MRRLTLVALCLAVGALTIGRLHRLPANQLQLGNTTFESGVATSGVEPEQYKKVISAVARTMGYPEPILSCIYRIESRYKSACSQRGACGLAQFMPQAAHEMQKAMARSPKYQTQWAKFRSEIGGDTSPRDFTAAAVRGAGGKADVQFFATALYFRHYYGYVDGVWEAILNDDPAKLTDYYHFLVIGYNAGPQAARRFLNHFRKDQKLAYKRIPRATRRYVKDLDACMSETEPAWTLTANLPVAGY